MKSWATEHLCLKELVEHWIAVPRARPRKEFRSFIQSISIRGLKQWSWRKRNEGPRSRGCH